MICDICCCKLDDEEIAFNADARDNAGSTVNYCYDCWEAWSNDVELDAMGLRPYKLNQRVGLNAEQGVH